MKKKWLLALTLSAMIFAISGCSSTTETTEETEEATGTEESTGSITEYASTIVTLGEYKGLAYTKVDTTVTDEEIQAELDYLLESYTTTEEVTDRTTVEEGDIVNIDYQGFVDGETSDSMTGEGYDLTIGSGQFIDGFEDGLIGQEVGTECVLDLTFPEVYSSEELQGKDVEFYVTINTIQATVIPELTDEFIQEYVGSESVEAYKEELIESYTAYKEENAVTTIEAELLEILIASSEFNMDESDYTSIVDEYVANYTSYATSMGVDYETFMETYMGMTVEEFEAEALMAAEVRVQNGLVMFAIIEAEGIELSDEEYTEGLNELYELYGVYYGIEDAAAFEEMYTKQIIEEEILYNMAFDILVENAVEAE